MENLHVLIVKYVGQTNTADSKVKIISECFKSFIRFSYDHNAGNALEQAEEWLMSKGFVLVGHGNGKGHYYVITSTFKNLH